MKPKLRIASLVLILACSKDHPAMVESPDAASDAVSDGAVDAEPDRALACGGDGQKCCPYDGRGFRCSEGFVCAPQGETCRRCGKPGEPCCPVERCEGGGCCVQDRCISEGETCSVGGVKPECRKGRCGCGREGEICCGYSCVESDTTCGPDSRCVKCGGHSQICCPTADPLTSFCSGGLTCRRLPQVLCAPPCGPGRTCGADEVCLGQGEQAGCLKCGKPGFPCCPGSVCSEGCCIGTGPNALPTCRAVGASCLGGETCSAAGCGTCGGEGQPCCVAGFYYCSASGMTCVDSVGQPRCAPCGRLGQPCCAQAYGTMPIPGCRAGLSCTRDPTKPTATCQPGL
jgi:hypothetical protein